MSYKKRKTIFLYFYHIFRDRDRRVKFIWQFLILILLIVSLVYLALPRPRLYHVDVETGTVQLTITDPAHNQWSGKGFILCDLTDNSDAWFNESTTETNTNSHCSGQNLGLAEELLPEPIIQFAKGAVISVEWNLGEGFNAVISSSDPALPSAKLVSGTTDKVVSLGTSILIHRPAQTDGAYTPPLTLPFEAYAIFGTDARVGVTGLLKSGTISVYEETPWAERYIAGERNLSRGDTVHFVDLIEGKPKAKHVRGFLRVEPNEEGVEQGIYAIAYSSIDTSMGLGDKSTVEVFRFGSAGYRFTPTLWTRIENAPDFILIFGFVGLLFALYEIYSIFLNMFVPTRDNDD